ncbi:MAG: DNA mismatch repair protein MutT [Bacteroidales bacterium]|nr:DNA mismatch repair protein MutT [Bacteroidales bacterium]
MNGIVNNVSVDCVIFGFDPKGLNVLLVERELKLNGDATPLIKDHTLIGYHIYHNERLHDAAERILHDLTGLKDIYLEQIFTFGDPTRLMSEKDQLWLKNIDMEVDNRTVTVVYYSLVDISKFKIIETGRKTNWFPIHELPELGFDHDKIVRKALEMLQVKVQLEPIVFELLPDKFTLTELQRVYEAVLDTNLDRRNFRKKIAQMKYVIPLDEKQKGVAHKPAQLYFFSREVYDKTKKDRYFIAI